MYSGFLLTEQRSDQTDRILSNSSQLLENCKRKLSSSSIFYKVTRIYHEFLSWKFEAVPAGNLVLIANRAKRLLELMAEIGEESRPAFLHKERIIEHMVVQCGKLKFRTIGPMHYVMKHLIKVIKLQQ